jgi:hypothetical protein
MSTEKVLASIIFERVEKTKKHLIQTIQYAVRDSNTSLETYCYRYLSDFVTGHLVFYTYTMMPFK